MTQQKTIALLVAKPGKEQELLSLLRALVGPSRAEAGNIAYDLWIDSHDPRRFVLDELYRDGAAILAHRQTSHFRDYLARVGELADRAAYVVDPLDVTA